ncbi:MAG: peptidoglycan binding domain-containing protein, partial [Polyangiaceae bacterium]
MRSVLLGAGGFLLVAGVGVVAGISAKNRYFPAGETLPGLTVDGAEVTGDLPLLVAARAESRLSTPVRFELDGVSVAEGKLSDLGVHVDEARTVALARALGHVEDLELRADLASRASEHQLDVPLSTTFDSAPVLEILTALKEDHDRPPVSARVDFEKGGARAEAPGKYVDVDAALARVADIAARPTATKNGEPQIVALQSRAFAPRIVSAFVKDIDIGETLSSFDTFFS